MRVVFANIPYQRHLEMLAGSFSAPTFGAIAQIQDEAQFFYAVSSCKHFCGVSLYAGFLIVIQTDFSGTVTVFSSHHPYIIGFAVIQIADVNICSDVRIR